jgi:hypothetical protein
MVGLADADVLEKLAHKQIPRVPGSNYQGLFVAAYSSDSINGGAA